MWIALAVGSAIMTAVIGTLTSAGLQKVSPMLGLAIQATILAVGIWGYVFFSGKASEVPKIEPKSWGILIAAGLAMIAANGLYYDALGQGPSSGVQPIDRLSLVFAIFFAAWFLREKITPVMIGGAVLMAIGAILIAVATPRGDEAGSKSGGDSGQSRSAVANNPAPNGLA